MTSANKNLHKGGFKASKNGFLLHLTQIQAPEPLSCGEGRLMYTFSNQDHSPEPNLNLEAGAECKHLYDKPKLLSEAPRLKRNTKNSRRAYANSWTTSPPFHGGKYCKSWESGIKEGTHHTQLKITQGQQCLSGHGTERATDQSEHPWDKQNEGLQGFHSQPSSQPKPDATQSHY